MAQRCTQVGEGIQQLHKIESLETELGIYFERKDLLRQALIHSSYLNENPGASIQSNERLEFLGDSIIGAVVAHDLYQRYPKWTEGELTIARSALVNGETLADVAESLKLGRYLNVGKGEDTGGGRERPTNLEAVLEALVGALFLDRGYDAARDFVLRFFSTEMSVLDRRSVVRNPKSALQEAVQNKGRFMPSYEIVEVSGKEHAPLFTVEVVIDGRVLGRGTGVRKSQAEQAAAAEALKVMEPHSL